MSSTILISSRMTPRSDSRSSSVKRGATTMSVRRSSAGLDLLVEHVRVERRVLLAGEGVDVAAEDVDDLGDVGGGALARCP